MFWQLFSLRVLLQRYNLFVTLPSSFYAVQRRGWLFDRRFKILVADGALCGAYVGEQPGVSAGASVAFTGADVGVAGCVIGLLLLPLELLVIHVLSERQQQREAQYSTLDPLSQEFLARDKGNFC